MRLYYCKGECVSLRTVCITFASLVLLLPVVQAGLCPDGCYCKHKFVDCSALMDFPTNLAKDTTRIRLTLMNIGEIPRYAFNYLPNLTLVEIEQSNIGVIAGCSFMDMVSLQELVFKKTVIGDIDRYAFNGLTNVKRIEFVQTRVGRLKSFAFYKLSKIANFNFKDSNFQYFYSNGLYDVKNISKLTLTNNNVSDIVTDAFRDVTVDFLHASLNTFWNMHCGVLDTLFQSATGISFRSNTFYCNCSIHWMLSTSGRQVYKDFLVDNKCHGPDKLNETASLASIEFSDLKCQDKTVDEPLTCNEVKLKIFNPTCDASYRPPAKNSGGPDSNDPNDKNRSTVPTLSLVMIISFTILCMLA